MNWSITITADDPSAVYEQDYTLDYAEGDDNSARPNDELVRQAQDAAANLAIELGAPALITIVGHEDTSPGESFKPGYVSITVSRVDPAAPEPAQEATPAEIPMEEETPVDAPQT